MFAIFHSRRRDLKTTKNLKIKTSFEILLISMKQLSNFCTTAPLESTAYARLLLQSASRISQNLKSVAANQRFSKSTILIAENKNPLLEFTLIGNLSFLHIK